MKLPIYYIRASLGRLRVENIRDNSSFEHSTKGCFDKKGKIKGLVNEKDIGHNSRYEEKDGFSHKRCLADDFSVCEATLNYFLSKIPSKKIWNKLNFGKMGVFVFQPIFDFEDGMTEMESRFFRDICENAGAQFVFIIDGDKSVFTKDYLEKEVLNWIEGKHIPSSIR